MKNVIFLLSLVFLFASCGSKEFRTIPLEKLDPILKEQAGIISSDFVAYVNGETSAHELSKQYYITPLMHRNLGFDGIYFFAPM